MVAEVGFCGKIKVEVLCVFEVYRRYVMLDVVKAKSREITKVTREKDCLVLCSEDGVLRLTVKTPGN